MLTDRAIGQDASAPPRAGPTGFQRPVVIRLDGVIDVRMNKFFHRRLAQAERLGADLVVVEIHSPGGLLTTSLEIAERLRDVDWARTVAFVPREAISGGAIVALGCDEILIGPQARLGDAGAITFSAELFAFVYVPAKAQSYLVRSVRDLAEAKGRPPELAEAMVDKDALVYWRRANPNAAPEFQIIRLRHEGDDARAAATAAGVDLNEWQLIEESGPERFLTVNGQRAVELMLASSTAQSIDELGTELGVTGPWVIYELNLTDSVAYWLTRPLITALLIAVGLVALYMELTAPGIGIGGLIAGLCAMLFFWSRFLGGTSGWLEVILFLAGTAFLVMELFVLPGWGICGILGLVLMVLSIILAGQEFVIPATPAQWNQTITSTLVLLCSGCVVLIAATYITRRLGSVPIFNRLMLTAPASVSSSDASKADGKPGPTAHAAVSVGDRGKAESLLRPAGRARFGHLSIDVVTDGQLIEPGQAIRVIEISGNRIVVTEVEPAGPSG
jgi:membrane-bound serine protease (ClpP class)